MLNENHKPQEEFQPGFWQHPFIQNTLPLLTSLVLHLSLIAIGVATMQVVKIVITDPNRVVVVPPGEVDFNPASNESFSLRPPGIGGADRPARQDKLMDVPLEARGISDHAGKIGKISVSFGGDGKDITELPAGIIAAGGSSVRGFGDLKNGRGRGNGPGVGDGDGEPAPFGVPGPGGGGPSKIFPTRLAHRIAYVCDASGSMLSMFDALRSEIRKSVDGLNPSQSFNLIFFQERGLMTADKVALMPAVPESKRKAFDFLDKVAPRGETDPIPALELAFRQGPELIYLLTDGDFSGPGNDAVVKYCADRTRDGKIKINTIAFVGRDSRDNPQDVEFVKALKAIARESGGRFRFVTDEDMGR